MEPEKTDKKIFKYYAPYDTPDGQDCLYKTVEFSKFGGLIGSWYALCEIAAVSKPKGIPAMAGRFMYLTAPAIGISASYAASACLFGSMRGKDDGWNHSFAGLLAAGLLGARANSAKVAGATGFVLFFGCGILKSLYKEGYFVYEGDQVDKVRGGFNHYKTHYGPRREVKPPENY